MSAIEIIIIILTLFGAFLSLLGSIGLIRFPDVYVRTHASAKSATLGVISIMVATFLYFLLIQGKFAGTILLAIIFVFLTAPVGALMIARAAYRSGVPLWEGSSQDDLKKIYEKKNEN